MESERTIATSTKTHATLNLCPDKTVINVNAKTTKFHKTILRSFGGRSYILHICAVIIQCYHQVASLEYDEGDNSKQLLSD